MADTTARAEWRSGWRVVGGAGLALGVVKVDGGGDDGIIHGKFLSSG